MTFPETLGATLGVQCCYLKHTRENGSGGESGVSDTLQQALFEACFTCHHQVLTLVPGGPLNNSPFFPIEKAVALEVH